MFFAAGGVDWFRVIASCSCDRLGGFSLVQTVGVGIVGALVGGFVVEESGEGDVASGSLVFAVGAAGRSANDAFGSFVVAHDNPSNFSEGHRVEFRGEKFVAAGF